MPDALMHCRRGLAAAAVVAVVLLVVLLLTVAHRA